MKKDFRVAVGFFRHPKTKKLERRLGKLAVLAWLEFLAHVAENKSDGLLAGMDPDDIAIAAGWDDDGASLVAALVELRMLDQTDEGLRVHDWDEHNSFAAGSAKRSEASRKAAEARWNRYAKPDDTPSNAEESEAQCDTQLDKDALKMRTHSESHKSAMPSSDRISSDRNDTNTPTPSPSPGGEGSEEEVSSGAGKGKAYTPEFESAWQEYPPRAGGNSKKAAFKAWNARLREGVSARILLDGVKRYRRFCEATGKVGTETVKMAASFFGPDEHYLESWDPPSAAPRPGGGDDPPLAPGRAGITTNGGKSVFEMLGVKQEVEPSRIREAAG